MVTHGPPRHRQHDVHDASELLRRRAGALDSKRRAQQAIGKRHDPLGPAHFGERRCGELECFVEGRPVPGLEPTIPQCRREDDVGVGRGVPAAGQDVGVPTIGDHAELGVRGRTQVRPNHFELRLDPFVLLGPRRIDDEDDPQVGRNLTELRRDVDLEAAKL